MDKAFEVHKLNADGITKANMIATTFDNLLKELQSLVGVTTGDPRLMAIVKTKLEEACFFAKKALASNPDNQTE